MLDAAQIDSLQMRRNERHCSVIWYVVV